MKNSANVRCDPFYVFHCASPGAIYHALSRGDRREAILLDDGDCHDFKSQTSRGQRHQGRIVQMYGLTPSIGRILQCN